MADLEIAYPTLDRSKDFGIVTPPWEGAHFEQGGFHFDANGDVVQELVTPELTKRLENAAARATADKAADAARKAALKKLGLDPSDPDLATKALDAVAASAANGGGDPPELDLVAWAKGEKPYPFAKVRGAALEQYDFVATDARALVAFMVDNSKIDQADVKVRGA